MFTKLSMDIESMGIGELLHERSTIIILEKNTSSSYPKVNTKAYSGTLTRREIARANTSLGELRRDKEKLSSPISCEFVRVKGK